MAEWIDTDFETSQWIDTDFETSQWIEPEVPVFSIFKFYTIAREAIFTSIQRITKFRIVRRLIDFLTLRRS